MRTYPPPITCLAFTRDRGWHLATLPIDLLVLCELEDYMEPYTDPPAYPEDYTAPEPPPLTEHQQQYKDWLVEQGYTPERSEERARKQVRTINQLDVREVSLVEENVNPHVGPFTVTPSQETP